MIYNLAEHSKARKQKGSNIIMETQSAAAFSRHFPWDSFQGLINPYCFIAADRTTTQTVTSPRLVLISRQPLGPSHWMKQGGWKAWHTEGLEILLNIQLLRVATMFCLEDWDILATSHHIQRYLVQFWEFFLGGVLRHQIAHFGFKHQQMASLFCFLYETNG